MWRLAPGQGLGGQAARGLTRHPSRVCPCPHIPSDSASPPSKAMGGPGPRAALSAAFRTPLAGLPKPLSQDQTTPTAAKGVGPSPSKGRPSQPEGKGGIAQARRLYNPARPLLAAAWATGNGVRRQPRARPAPEERRKGRSQIQPPARQRVAIAVAPERASLLPEGSQAQTARASKRGAPRAQRASNKHSGQE